MDERAISCFDQALLDTGLAADEPSSSSCGRREITLHSTAGRFYLLSMSPRRVYRRLPLTGHSAPARV